MIEDTARFRLISRAFEMGWSASRRNRTVQIASFTTSGHIYGSRNHMAIKPCMAQLAPMHSLQSAWEKKILQGAVLEIISLSLSQIKCPDALLPPVPFHVHNPLRRARHVIPRQSIYPHYPHYCPTNWAS